MRECYSNYPNSNGFPCFLCEDKKECKGSGNKAECYPDYKSHVYCEKCNFNLGTVSMIDAVFKISMDGGYVKYDGEGGLITECPECHEHSIVFET